MSLSTLFARRHLLSRKSHSVINIISRVSSVAIGVPVAAMIILLSVFNGFESLVKSMYRDFDPDIIIRSREGKTFPVADIDKERILDITGVEVISDVLEDNALLEYRGRQEIATVRGVGREYNRVVPFEKMVVAGKYEIWYGDIMQAVIGRGLAYNLGLHTALLEKVSVLVPRRGVSFSSLLPLDSYRQQSIFPEGIFALDADTDSKYMIVPIEFTQSLLDYPGMASFVAVRISPGADENKVRAEIAAATGDNYEVLTRYQQNASVYQIMTYEKWGIFVIIMMVMIIASFSLVGSLVMLIIDKRGDIRTIINMGGDVRLIRKIFVTHGMMLSLIGGLCGLALGLILCWLQTSFGFIRIPAESFLIDSYPVRVQFGDIISVVVVLIAVSYIITKFTVMKMVPKSVIRQ